MHQHGDVRQLPCASNLYGARVEHAPPQELGIDGFQADHAPDQRYRTAPLKGLWTQVKGGFHHDGRFATLTDIVDHYNAQFSFGMTDQEKSDLIQYVMSL
jgi:cytochrome c peroxidase